MVEVEPLVLVDVDDVVVLVVTLHHHLRYIRSAEVPSGQVDVLDSVYFEPLYVSVLLLYEVFVPANVWEQTIAAVKANT